MVATIFSWAGGLVAVWVAWRVMVQAYPDDGVGRALSLLKRHRTAGPIPDFDASRAGVLSRDVLSPGESAAALAELKITLSEVRRDTARARTIPRAASRIALALGTAMALVELARGLGNGSGLSPSALLCFAGGFVASSVAGLMGHRARLRAEGRNKEWAELAAALTSRLLAGDAG